MSSDSNPQSPQKLPVARLAVLGVVLCVFLTALFSLAGCNWWKRDSGLVDGNDAHPRDAVAVFFSKYQGSQSIVESVVRKLPQEAQKEPLPYAVSELLKGPTSEEKTQGFYSEIPQGTQLLGVTQDDGTVTVNLSQPFSGGGGSTSMTQRFEELKQTVYAVDSKHTMKVLVDGKPLELLGGEGLEVQDSAKRDIQ